jgi:hypothetical protein
MTGCGKDASLRINGFQLSSTVSPRIDGLARCDSPVIQILPCAKAAPHAGQHEDPRIAKLVQCVA